MLIYFIIGIISGLGSGLFGIGGGAIRIPLLTLMGMPMISAYGINLLVIPFSSAAGAWTHRKNIQWNIAPWIVFGGLTGSISGALIAGLLHGVALALIFFFVSLLTVSGIYLDKILPKISEKIDPGKPTFLTGAFITNLITGMRGGSGGTLLPSFLRMLKLDMHKSIATSLFTTIFCAMAGAIVYWSRGIIDWRHALIITTGSLIGVRTGSKIALKTKPAWIEASLSTVVITLAFIALIKVL
ncbi:sulfite exporter TauE/SafE family protein [bacterium]|nr:sulfite exporter TauE/SafE family protein [bacterium]